MNLPILIPIPEIINTCEIKKIPLNDRDASCFLYFGELERADENGEIRYLEKYVVFYSNTPIYLF